MAFDHKRKNALEYDSVLQAAEQKAAHEATKLADWSGGTYGQSVKDALDKINNRQQFKYDLNGDMLYNQYKDQYINAGRLAMADTMGQAAAMTGGYGNSYAATVGNQAYQGYLQKLNDKVPELYQMALNKYNQEGQDLKDNLAIQQSLYNTEYGEYRDKVADWNTQQNRLDSLYAAALDWATNDANTDYNSAFARYQQDVAEQQYAQNFAYQQERDRIADEQWNKQYALSKASAAASRASANQSAKIAELQNEINYRDALETLGNGIKVVNHIDTKNHKSTTGYTVMGKAYKTKAEAEKAVTDYLDKLNLTDASKAQLMKDIGLIK